MDTSGSPGPCRSGDQTDQESRSVAHRPAISLTAMDSTIHG
jgi:hypothetical protein